MRQADCPIGKRDGHGVQLLRTGQGGPEGSWMSISIAKASCHCYRLPLGNLTGRRNPPPTGQLVRSAVVGAGPSDCDPPGKSWRQLVVLYSTSRSEAACYVVSFSLLAGPNGIVSIQSGRAHWHQLIVLLGLVFFCTV